MAKKYVEINGVTFEIMNYPRVIKSGKNLWECYDNPSKIKESIYNEWKNWFYEIGAWFLGVQTYNTMQFTLGGEINYGGKAYSVYITKAHNRLYPHP